MNDKKNLFNSTIHMTCDEWMTENGLMNGLKDGCMRMNE